MRDPRPMLRVPGRPARLVDTNPPPVAADVPRDDVEAVIDVQGQRAEVQDHPTSRGDDMTDEPMPPSPLTALAEGAAQTHELYRAYVEAGFTEAQGMQLICTMLAESLRGGRS